MLEVWTWRRPHRVLVVHAVAALPDLPLGRGRLVRLGAPPLGAEQQEGEQGGSQQEAGPPDWKAGSVTRREGGEGKQVVVITRFVSVISSKINIDVEFGVCTLQFALKVFIISSRP